jgi:hypothetical protein
MSCRILNAKSAASSKARFCRCMTAETNRSRKSRKDSTMSSDYMASFTSAFMKETFLRTTFPKDVLFHTRFLYARIAKT